MNDEIKPLLSDLARDILDLLDTEAGREEIKAALRQLVLGLDNQPQERVVYKVGYEPTYRLCYVECDDSGGEAWFTPRPVHEEWGDEWNDAPYQHNASSPYASDVVKVRFIVSGFQTPSQYTERWLSVQDINGRSADSKLSWPWLKSKDGVVLYAGTTYSDFESVIESEDGMVSPLQN